MIKSTRRDDVEIYNHPYIRKKNPSFWNIFRNKVFRRLTIYPFGLKIDIWKKLYIRLNMGTSCMFDFDDFYRWVVLKHRDYKNFVEVGVWKGHSISYLAKLLKLIQKNDFKVYAVDLFENSPDFKKAKQHHCQLPVIYEIYNTVLRKTNTRDYIYDIIEDSAEAANRFQNKSLDFVFIDTAINYDSAKRDILAWKPKVRVGGILGGHDYHLESQGIIKSVNEIFFPRKIKQMSRSVWYLYIK